jgi:hypothetical protein
MSIELPALDPMDPGVENSVSEFVRLDTEMKLAKKQLKGVRDTIDEHRALIIEYMVKSGTDKLVGINGGTQYLECVQKTLKHRPTSEQMLEKISELLKSGTTDPAAVLDAIQKCGGTHVEYRLSRRTRRISATAAAAAVVAANTKKPRRLRAKKRKVVVNNSDSK